MKLLGDWLTLVASLDFVAYWFKFSTVFICCLQHCAACFSASKPLLFCLPLGISLMDDSASVLSGLSVAEDWGASSPVHLPNYNEYKKNALWLDDVLHLIPVHLNEFERMCQVYGKQCTLELMLVAVGRLQRMDKLRNSGALMASLPKTTFSGIEELMSLYLSLIHI